ncbi:unnamed protein product, partial [Laminaria digitata]
MNWQTLANNGVLHGSNGSIVPGGPMNTLHDEILPSGSGLISDVNTTGRPYDDGVEITPAQHFLGSGVTTRDTANSSSGSGLSQSQCQSLGAARPVSGRATDMDMMDMDMEDEESTDHQDSHHYARTELSINTPTSTNIVATSPPSQEGFVGGGGFGTGSKSVLNSTLSPRSPVGAGSNTWGDPGVTKSRMPERLAWSGRNDTPQAQAASAASAASAAGKARSRKQCEECGSVIGRWGAVVPSGLSQNRAKRSLGGKSCGSCGGFVTVERESESRLQEDWSKTSSPTFTTPSAPERSVERGTNMGSDNGGGRGSSKGEIYEHRRMPSGAKAIPHPANEDGGSHDNHGDHGGHVQGAEWVSKEARLASVADDEGQARAARTKQSKRGREEEDSAAATPLSSTDSRLARRRRGNDVITPMPRLSWGPRSDDSATHTSIDRTASSGSV